MIIGLTWGGVTYSWSSWRVLVPLLLGLFGIVLFVYLERFSKHPTIPFDILLHYTSVAGYIICFLHSLLVLSIRELALNATFFASPSALELTSFAFSSVYFFPVYLQSVVGDSPVMSGVHCFTLSFTLAPMALLVGFSINKFAHYKYQTVAGLALILVGLGLMTLLTGHSRKAEWIG
jgi:hypothetical protein